MSGNSFADKNLHKLVWAPKFLAGDLLSRVVPRVPGRWAVGSHFGVNDGARAVAEEVLRRDGQRVVWFAQTDAEARDAHAIGARVVRHGTLRGFWVALRSEIVVLTHGFGDVSRFGSRGARVVQLWHGTPLKRLHRDSPAVMRLPVLGGGRVVAGVLRRLYAVAGRRIEVFPVSSPEAGSRVTSAFGLAPGQVSVVGEPRTDILFAGDQQERRDRARARLEHTIGELGQSRVILFAPTWRDGAQDPVLPTEAEWAEIEDFLEARDGVLVIRQHPHGAGAYTHTSHRVRHLPSAAEKDLTAVLAAVDVLVSDYSSTIVDFAATGGPVVFLAPDATAYAREHGLYDDYASITDGRAVPTWSAALAALAAVLTPGERRDRALAHSAALAARFHPHRDGLAAARVVDTVLTGAPSPDASHAMVPGTGGRVFLESFNGRNVSCNPLALDRELTRRLPGLTRSWSVVDESIEVPPGAVAVRVGTPEWVAARAAAHLVITNDWIEDRWRPARSQVFLQTWHGTPLKRIALTRRHKTVREMAAVIRQSSRWTALLAQSPVAAGLLRRSYAVTAPVWTEGYPRNDVIVRGVGTEVRERLGIGTARVVLYAPTWRDGELDKADPLDVPRLAELLGSEWTVLVRGHARTAQARRRTQADRVIDVTDYPDASDLLASADVLVTDYSSVMFDFSASGRPMVFFVPDLADYRDRTRGFLMDLDEIAPGPRVTTVSECAAAVAGAREQAPQWAERYSSWRGRFNPLDDGSASARVVDRILALRPFPRP